MNTFLTFLFSLYIESSFYTINRDYSCETKQDCIAATDWDGTNACSNIYGYRRKRKFLSYYFTWKKDISCSCFAKMCIPIKTQQSQIRMEFYYPGKPGGGTYQRARPCFGKCTSKALCDYNHKEHKLECRENLY